MRKSQAALEFLTTYGWAFLVILIMIAALAYFGILSPSKLLPDRCNFGAEIGCRAYTIAKNGLNLRLSNNAGEAIIISAVSVSSEKAQLSGCTSPIVGTTQWKSGEVKDVPISCSDFANSGLTEGEKGKLNIKISYYAARSSSSFSKDVNGEVYSIVQVTETVAGTSCKDALSKGFTSDGVYTINPTGTPIEVYCDMTTDGGGWTLVYKTNMANSNDRTDNGYNMAALALASVNDVAVFSRSTINQIGSTFRISSTDGKTLFWTGMPFYTTDNHPSGTFSVQTKLAWAAPWSAGNYAFNPLHSLCIVSGATFTPEHFCTQRWCCGSPNEGLWFNGGAWSPGYYSGTVWVR